MILASIVNTVTLEVTVYDFELSSTIKTYSLTSKIEL